METFQENCAVQVHREEKYSFKKGRVLVHLAEVQKCCLYWCDI